MRTRVTGALSLAIAFVLPATVLFLGGAIGGALGSGADSLWQGQTGQNSARAEPMTNTLAVYLPLVTTPYRPLFVGLQVRWDGNGYLRGSQYYDVGHHLELNCDAMTDADTIRCHGHDWYAPDPFGWGPSEWYEYYSVSTGHFRSSSVPGDPSWKWGSCWIVPFGFQFRAGQTVLIAGQGFSVSGPHSGYTSFGKAIQYWELVNLEKFLFWDGGGDWTQHVDAGDITLWYDAGRSRLRLYRNVLRRDHYQGVPTGDTVQYIHLLTQSNAFPSTGAISESGHFSRRSTSHAGPFPGADLTEQLDLQQVENLRRSRHLGPLEPWNGPVHSDTYTR